MTMANRDNSGTTASELFSAVHLIRDIPLWGKHESFTDAETVEGLSYLSLELYLGRNIFQHIVPSNGPLTTDLALFTHAPISELVYLLAGAAVQVLGDAADGTFKLSGGDSGRECWQKMTTEEMRRTLHVVARQGNNILSDDDEYEEPAEGGKKRKPKPPRGAPPKKSKTRPKPALAKARRRKPSVKEGRRKGQGRARGRKKGRKIAWENLFIYSVRGRVNLRSRAQIS
ncbi:hypothetical protein B0H13DRAFT_1850117 [Mycena leptocephala]|nr:hypothetical protein B0H13DRAFT_1850117 [Mycena leptocephala]